jgi:dienelactone hydrolase
MLRSFVLIFLLSLSLTGRLGAQVPKDAAVSQSTTLTVGSRQVSLAAGARVQVLSQRGTKAVISFTAPDGSPVITQVDLSVLTFPTAPANKVAPTNSTAPAPMPALVAPTPNPTVGSASVKTSVPAANTTPLVEGWQKMNFPELPAPDVERSWITYNSDPKQEVFHVYVPKGFDPKKTYGFLGWIDPSPNGMPPKQFQALYDEYGLIVVGVEKAGNSDDVWHRVALMVSSLLEISKWVKIDPARRLITGFSGGARASCIAAFCYPDLFSGVVPWCGAEFYEDVPNLANSRSVWYGYVNEFNGKRPSAEDLDKVRDQIKFALLTGTTDSNLVADQSIAATMKEKRFKVTVIVQKGMGHGVGTADIMRQGLDFVLKKDDAPPGDQ